MSQELKRQAAPRLTDQEVLRRISHDSESEVVREMAKWRRGRKHRARLLASYVLQDPRDLSGVLEAKREARASGKYRFARLRFDKKDPYKVDLVSYLGR